MIYAGNGEFWSCGYKYTSPDYFAVVSQSTDAGATWTRHTLYSGSSYGYVRAIAADPNNTDKIFALGYKNSTYTLFKTEDGGTSWTESTATGFSGTPYDLLVNPSDPNMIAAASSSGLYCSNDAGATWAKISSGFTTCYGLSHSEAVNKLFLSTNAGVWGWDNWTGTPAVIGDDPGFSSVKCAMEVAGEFLFAGTTGASAWSAYIGVSTWEEESSAVESELALSVSPNPVNRGQAAVSFYLPVSSEMEITVYDLTGRTVRSVDAGELTSGSHEIQLMTHDMMPGVYFTVVKGGSFSESFRFTVSE